MKLLELHIRNIASIERADIDFENQDGLMDHDTGRPAQKFLIFGDTGTGKSVLLDAISMALYCNTPRISDVANSQKNWYKNTDGQAVSVSHIEQYTRLGIADKDECYSEVVFLDNQDNRYHAKLELGFTKGRNGLKYRKKWLFKDGNTDWTEIKQDRENMIADIIGMTFSQFNRMVMLAQGQFAQFLCGKRDQRADILEKLTNTSIFSTYGDAISSIYKRKESAAVAAKQHFATVSQFVMEPESVAQLSAQIDADSEMERDVVSRRKSLMETIATLKKVEEASLVVAQADKELAELQRVMDSDEYKENQALCSDWDNTDNERRALENMHNSEQLLMKALNDEKSLMNHFAELSKSLVAYNQAVAKEEQSLRDEGEWLKSRQERAQLYNDAKLYVEKVSQYKKTVDSLEQLRKELKVRQSSCVELEKVLTNALKLKEAAEKEVSDAQAVIDELILQRDALDQQATDARINELQKIIRALEKLQDDYNVLIEKQKEVKCLNDELKALESSIKESEFVQQECKTRNEQDRVRYEKALARLTTIKSSLSDTLNDLRKKMVDENADICPLCGQKITEGILSNEQFANVISPFDVEEKEAKAKYDKSLKELSDAEKNLSELRSKHGEKSKAQETTAKDIDKMEKDIAPRLEKAKKIVVGWESQQAREDAEGDDFVQAMLCEGRKNAENELQQLMARREKVTQLQSSIDKRLKEKQDVDSRRDKAQQVSQKALFDVDKNKECISQIISQIAEEEEEMAAQSKEIDATVAPWFPAWVENVEETVKKLLSESEEYLMRKRKQDERTAQVASSKEKSAEMEATRQRIAKSHNEWGDFLSPQNEGQNENVSFKVSLSDWNSLAEKCSSVASVIGSQRDVIANSKLLIDGWIERTGGSMEKLERLLKHKDAIQPTRLYLAEQESNVKSWRKSRLDADETVRLGREVLHLADDEPLPQISELEQQLSLLEELERTVHDRITEARSKIETNEKNLKTREEAELSLQKAEKESCHWELLYKTFGGDRFRNLVQTHILRPLLNNANIYLHQISDRYTLTCDDENEQLSIFVLDGYNRDEVRSMAVLSGGEKFMISLALSLALSSLNRPDMNMNILFIDEGFGTLDQEYLDSVMKTLGRLSELADQRERRVGIISHREELLSCIPNKIKLVRTGEGRSRVDVVYEP